MALDTEHGFRLWFKEKYTEQAFQEEHRFIGSSEPFGFGLADMKAAYEAGVKWRENESERCPKCGSELDKIDISEINDRMQSRYLMQCYDKNCGYNTEIVWTVGQ